MEHAREKEIVSVVLSLVIGGKWWVPPDAFKLRSNFELDLKTEIARDKRVQHRTQYDLPELRAPAPDIRRILLLELFWILESLQPHPTAPQAESNEYNTDTPTGSLRPTHYTIAVIIL